MDIKYYDFQTSIGQMIIFFSSKGIIYLNLTENRYKDNIEYVNNKYGQARKVDKIDYNYHNQIVEYLKGDLKKFSLSIDLYGTDFQKKVWLELLEIPYGTTKTYKEIAYKIGSPKAYRAVGGVLNKNPILIIIPCHRVIGTNGSLIGFAGGISLKKRLLDMEMNSQLSTNLSN